MTASRTIVVVPCYNEEERLDAGAFESFARARPDVTFLFVDDGSRDGTHDLLQRIVQRHPGHFALLALDQNRGKAEAVRQGLLDACRRGATSMDQRFRHWTFPSSHVRWRASIGGT